MYKSLRFRTPKAIGGVSGTFLSLLLLASPTVVMAHGGHGNEFHQETEATQNNTSIQVDADTAKHLGIKVEPVQRQRLAVGIKTTGEIETLPSQKVEVTTPIQGAKVVELLVEPGTSVKQGQPVAVVTSPDLVTLRVESQEKLAQAQADLQQAQADLKLAQQNYERYQQIATSEITQAKSQVDFAQEKYSRDKQLADNGALPRRDALESQTQLTQAKTELTKASSQRDVISAENQLKRAQAAVQLAKSNIIRSNNIYQARLSQLGTIGNSQGLVTITAPISGKVADREVTIGQTFNDAGGKLMTIINDSQLFATANIYEKDLSRVRTGQRIILKVANLSDRTFSGQIFRVGTVIEKDTRIVPVQAQVNNSLGQLKAGMFAEIEILTNQTSPAILVIPTSAVVDANNKKLVYLQNGNAFQAVEVTLGQTSGDMVEVKSGLFEGDMIVTQRAPQLYAQSLRGGGEVEEQGSEGAGEKEVSSNSSLPWLAGVGGGVAIATIAFLGGVFWSNRRNKPQLLSVMVEPMQKTLQDSSNSSASPDDNHHASDSEPKFTIINKNTQL